MPTNLERYKKDLDLLINKGRRLQLSMESECFPDGFESRMTERYGDKANEVTKALPKFDSTYQSWYSEAMALIKQLLPDRLADFIRHYEKPKPRKDLSAENYRIEDYLQGLQATRRGVEIVGRSGAFPHFHQQLAILEAAEARFESSLFNIRQLVQADLFDSELDVAKDLAKNKFLRPAGAVAGVVLERHLMEVCDNHVIKVRKPLTISKLNDALKDGSVITVPDWRFIQHLGDIRNLCVHSKESEPTDDDVDDLINGVVKITKTVF